MVVTVAQRDVSEPRRSGFRLGDPVGGLIGLLAAYRLVYHLSYVRDVPFAVAPFSDGRSYEIAAIDILEHGPWGTEPFYLQGIYAYFLALPMTYKPWVSLGMLLQVVLSAGAIWLLARTMRRLFDRTWGRWTAVVYLAYPMLMFYENKFLTGAMTIVSLVVLLWTVAVASKRRTGGWWLAVGVAVAMTMLWRPNLALVVPFVAWAIWQAEDKVRPAAGRALVFCGLGIALGLAPMMIRNVVVTGKPTVFPAHGGGTSFYIGNNAAATGVWNDAGGLLSGDVTQERGELLRRLEIEVSDRSEQAPAIGRALYRRAMQEISDDPGRWLGLETKKLWLVVGNDELTQDYDLHGEIAMLPFAHRVGLPYGVLQAIGLLGLVLLTRRSREEAALRPFVAVLWGVLVATLGSNLLFFTSSQHRLPLALVWVVGFVAGARFLLASLRDRKFVVPAVVAIAIALSMVPRTTKREPSAVFFYNLGLAYARIGEPQNALWAFDHAVEKRPDHPVLRIERARYNRILEHYGEAQADLDAIEAMPNRPHWVDERLAGERMFYDGAPSD
jgi:4-amino-4-deoxy-L-arabinose transferase-like glycosyltransferase